MSNRAVFLDRDGTLIEHYDYLTDPDQVQLLPHTVPALKLLKQHGFMLVMITNQSAVARGMLTEKTLHRIHDHLEELLTRGGAYLDRIYYCPYHPEATEEKYRRDSDLRKPKPGMLYLAAQELNIDLAQSWIVGDDDRDVETGRTAGCRTVMLETRGSSLVHKGRSAPDFFAVNLQEGANLILRHAQTNPLSGEEENPPEVQTEIPPSEPTEMEEEKKEAPPLREPRNQESPSTATTPSEIEAPTAVTAPAPSATAEERDYTIEQQLDVPAQVITQVNTQSLESSEPNLTDTIPSSREADNNRASKSRADTLLSQILRELKDLNRDRALPTEFSLFKLLAGIVQMLVIFCLVLAFWLGTGPEAKAISAQNCLLLALIFQTLTLTLLLIHR